MGDSILDSVDREEDAGPSVGRSRITRLCNYTGYNSNHQWMKGKEVEAQVSIPRAGAVGRRT